MMKESDIRPQDLFNRYLELSRKDIGRFFSDQSKFVDVPCPACLSERHEPGMKKLGFRYLTCLDCSSLYLSPRPTVAMFDDYYQEAESVKFWGTDFFKATSEARRERMFKPRAQMVEQWAAKLGMDGSDSFADVGSGYGIFLEEISNLNRFGNVVGVEPAPNLAEICREKGFGISEKLVEEVQDGEIEASFASAFEVIEHPFDPAEFLNGVHRLLKPDGMFLFTTLTISGFDMQVLWEHSKSIYPPHHINLMSVSGIKTLVERSGFEIAELSTPGQLDVDIIRNIVTENPEIELNRFAHHMAFGVSDEVRAAFQSFLQAQNLSSHIRVIARAK